MLFASGVMKTISLTQLLSSCMEAGRLGCEVRKKRYDLDKLLCGDNFLVSTTTAYTTKLIFRPFAFLSFISYQINRSYKIFTIRDQ